MARLVLNGGSSSWKCGVYDVAADARARDADATPALAEVRLAWHADDDDAEIETDLPDGTQTTRHDRVAREHAIPAILNALTNAGIALANLESIGHRIVHGAGDFTQTTWLEPPVIEKLRALEPFAPSHNPLELAAVEAVGEHLPNLRQYAVFDTQFHRTLSEIAYTYPGPYAWREKKIRRYGFHGSSVAYATERATELLEREPGDTQLIVAHLGSGCSVTAVRNGESVDTSMGFTPLEGTMMSTRSGSIDPAIAIFLMREAARNDANASRSASNAALTDFANALDHTLNTQSGLAGLSGISGDLREIRQAANDPRARLAIDVFIHRLAATIGSLLPALDRLDAIVFTGGIGEHDAAIRDATTARLAYLFSPTENRVRTYVLTAREEWFIAREGARLAATRNTNA